MGCRVSLLAHSSWIFTFPWSHFILNLMLGLSRVKVTKIFNWYYFWCNKNGIFTFLSSVNSEESFMNVIQRRRKIVTCGFLFFVWFFFFLVCWMLNCKKSSLSPLFTKTAIIPFQKFICDFIYLDIPFLVALLGRFWSCLFYKKIFVVKVSHP